ncbi:hypothetical protein LSAT2_021782 [Lamellibrachia satsuma]|nr:hypothetical protein LSAT2_021782 [Lamellibrachia satsuma]
MKPKVTKKAMPITKVCPDCAKQMPTACKSCSSCNYMFRRDVSMPSPPAEHLSLLNAQLQGREQLINEFCQFVSAFQTKLQLWEMQLRDANYMHFPTLMEYKPDSPNTLRMRDLLTRLFRRTHKGKHSATRKGQQGFNMSDIRSCSARELHRILKGRGVAERAANIVLDFCKPASTPHRSQVKPVADIITCQLDLLLAYAIITGRMSSSAFSNHSRVVASNSASPRTRPGSW